MSLYYFHCSCGYCYLKSVEADERHKCCLKGKANDEDEFPQLEFLPLTLHKYLLSNTEHISKSATYYNNMFQLASILVDNGRADPQFEKFTGGVGACKLNGRVELYLKNTKNTSCGLNYFTFDAKYVL